MNLNTKELKNRVEAKKHTMLARVAELKANTASTAKQELERIESQLRDLEDTLRDAGGEVSDKIAQKLNGWLERTNVS